MSGIVCARILRHKTDLFHKKQQNLFKPLVVCFNSHENNLKGNYNQSTIMFTPIKKKTHRHKLFNNISLKGMLLL